MKILIKLTILLFVLTSCNVIQTLSQGETEVDSEFYDINTVDFHSNALTNLYTKSKDYFGKVETLVPTSSIAVSSGTPVAESFGTDWNSALSFSTNQGVSITTANWVKEIVLLSNTDTYDSPTWRALNTMNTLCAAGILIGEQISMTEFDYPPNGTYNTYLGNTQMNALVSYCGVSSDDSMIGQNISVTVSDPASTLIYDKQIDMMGSTYFIKYDTNSMAFAGSEINDDGLSFTKVVMSDDQVSNGFTLSFIRGPNNTSLALEETNAMRVYYDSTAAATGLAALEYRETYNSSPDSETTFFVGGYLNSGNGIVVHVLSSNLVHSETNYFACLLESDWSITADGTDCSAGSGLAGIPGDSSSSVEFHNVFTNWSTNLSTNSSVHDSSTPGFSSIGDMGTGAF